MKKVCVFGASITSGCNDIVNGGWCDILKCHLLKKDILVFNLGIPGNDTNDLDGLHPTTNGHKLLFERIKDNIEL